MDDNSKKKIWKLLKECDFKKDKIILITTNCINEAEYLGDRIGILFEGNLICPETDLNKNNNIYINLFLENNYTPSGNEKEEILEKLKQIVPNLEIEEYTEKNFFYYY